jgi:hypothetical protein
MRASSCGAACMVAVACIECDAGMSLTRTEAISVQTIMQSADHAEKLMAELQACATRSADDHADSAARRRRKGGETRSLICPLTC